MWYLVWNTFYVYLLCSRIQYGVLSIGCLVVVDRFIQMLLGCNKLQLNITIHQPFKINTTIKTIYFINSRQGHQAPQRKCIQSSVSLTHVRQNNPASAASVVFHQTGFTRRSLNKLHSNTLRWMLPRGPWCWRETVKHPAVPRWQQWRICFLQTWTSSSWQFKSTCAYQLIWK